MAVALIAAVAANGVIGREGRLPWHLPPDLRRFRSLTMGHWLVFGRKTFEGIGRPLPGREIVVMTRQRGWSAAPGSGVREVARSLEEALGAAAAAGAAEVFIGGGGEIYREAIASGAACRLHLTRVHADFAGDASFPALDLAGWEEVEREPHAAGDEAPFAYTFHRYERRPAHGA